MNETQHAVHPDVDELINYFASRLSATSQELLEQHFAECKQCSQLARRVWSSTHVLEQWSTGSPLRNDLCTILHRSLLNLLDQPATKAWRDRLEIWTTNWAGKAEGAVRVVMEAPGKAATIVTDGLSEVLHPKARWRFALELMPAPIRGESEPHTISLASTTTTPRARLAVSNEAREIEARIDDWPAGQNPPLVLLVPIREDLEPRVAELRRPSGISYCIARFERVEPGDYLIAIEPQP
jgi:hypothetical protein